MQDKRRQFASLDGEGVHLAGTFIDPIFRAWGVWHDFDYPSVENLPARDARRRIECLRRPVGEARMTT